MIGEVAFTSAPKFEITFLIITIGVVSEIRRRKERGVSRSRRYDNHGTRVERGKRKTYPMPTAFERSMDLPSKWLDRERWVSDIQDQDRVVPLALTADRSPSDHRRESRNAERSGSRVARPPSN